MRNVFLLFGVLFISGCILQNQPEANQTNIIANTTYPTPASKDLQIKYSYGACKAEWGLTKILIYANGSGIYEKGRGQLLENGRFEQEEFHKIFTLSESEMRGLLNRIETSGFYSLNNYYSDSSIMDGGCDFISVTQNNKTKSVAVSNMQAPAAYSKAADLIYLIAVNKTK